MKNGKANKLKLLIYDYRMFTMFMGLLVMSLILFIPLMILKKATLKPIRCFIKLIEMIDN
jgi:hypothetical protein